MCDGLTRTAAGRGPCEPPGTKFNHTRPTHLAQAPARARRGPGFRPQRKRPAARLRARALWGAPPPGFLSYAFEVSFALRQFPTEEGTLMGPLPLPVLIGVVSLLAIGTLYFVWVRKLPKK